MEKFIIAVYVENKTGVLTRVAGMFTRRGFNIDTLTAIFFKDGKAHIDQTLCVGCNVCGQACPFGAIERK